MQAHENGSDIRVGASKGSRFWARPSQTFGRVRTFGEYLQMVRTFWHMLARAMRGFAFVATHLRKQGRLRISCKWKFAKGSLQAAMRSKPQQRVRTFARKLQRVRAFGHVFAQLSKGFVLLNNFCKGFALLATRSLEPRRGSHFWG